MASLTRYTKGWKIRYRVYYPTGTHRTATVFRSTKRDADHLVGMASQLEPITRQNALTHETAIPFVHWHLLKDEDVQQWFPGRVTLAFDADVLLDAYARQCQARMTSSAAIHRNLFRAKHLLARLGNLGVITSTDIQRWQEERASERTRKTVNLEMDVLRQLLDLCHKHGWRQDNPARALKKLPWKQSRLPKALTFDQAHQALERARVLGAGAPPSSLKGQLYRLVVASLFFGLRRGELQYLLGTDTNGRQVFIQGKDLPDGTPWLPKDREARVIEYPGIAQPIDLVFGNAPPEGYVFAPTLSRDRPFHSDSLTAIIDKHLLRPIGPGLTLHSLRHTFATWRLEQGDSLIRVRALMGHADANTLLRYAHVHPSPLTDLLSLL
jgi:integrase